MGTRWELDEHATPTMTVEEALECIEDALAHGFIFKVENHSLYFGS